MKKIKLLNDSMINKIAAGEVVERPNSVVKELVENSIDAGASVITIEISQNIIRVSDNGIGIPYDDVEIVFLRHATNKIENIEDLENILSLGFRGEAMSSISAVSKLELITKNINEDMGTVVEIVGGKVVKKQRIGAAKGTSVIVRDLFFNVPARLKFLKKTATEQSHITDTIEKFILGNPNITFNYILNSKKRTLGGRGLKYAIYEIYGKEYYKDLIEINKESKDNIFISGYIGKPILYRQNRSFGNFFINGRYIKNKILQNAVEDVYKTKLPISKFPVYVLNIKINPSLVDVNVHPTKLEIRFQNEEKIYNLLYNNLRESLDNDILIPDLSLVSKNKKEDNIFLAKTNPVYKAAEIKNFPKVSFKNPISFDKFKDDEIYNNYIQDSKKVEVKTEETSSLSLNEIINISENQTSKESFFEDYKLIGSFFDTYLIIEKNSELFFIDQHAAHERIWYDKLIEQIENNQPIYQILLTPIKINFSSTEEDIFIRYKDDFFKLGFKIENIAEGSFFIREVPFFITINYKDVLFEILEKIKNNTKEKFDTNKLAGIACKAAVKGKDKLDILEQRKLIDELIKTKNPFTCPHGRPTIVKFTKYEIEKMFKRV